MSKYASVCYRVLAATVCVGGLLVPTVPLRACPKERHWTSSASNCSNC